jgi:hypothetical protein
VEAKAFNVHVFSNLSDTYDFLESVLKDFYFVVKISSGSKNGPKF